MFYKSLSSILRRCDCIMFSGYSSSSSSAREKSAREKGVCPGFFSLSLPDCILIMMPKWQQKEQEQKRKCKTITLPQGTSHSAQ